MSPMLPHPDHTGSNGVIELIDTYVHPHGFCLANFDPALVISADLANLMIFGAYCLGFPFAAWRLFPGVPKQIRATYILGILFVYSCGISHLLDIVITHKASYNLYLIVTAERAFTGIISWLFVASVFHDTRKAGLRICIDDEPASVDTEKPSGG